MYEEPRERKRLYIAQSQQAPVEEKNNSQKCEQYATDQQSYSNLYKVSN